MKIIKKIIYILVFIVICMLICNSIFQYINNNEKLSSSDNKKIKSLIIKSLQMQYNIRLYDEELFDKSFKDKNEWSLYNREGFFYKTEFDFMKNLYIQSEEIFLSVTIHDLQGTYIQTYTLKKSRNNGEYVIADILVDI